MLSERRSAPDRSEARNPPGDGAIGRAAVRGAVMGYVAVVILVATILLVAGAQWGVALAVGAFVGIWGGPGWGGMVAAQRQADRIAEDEREAKTRGATS